MIQPADLNGIKIENENIMQSGDIMLPGLFPSSKNAISAISACWDYDGFSQMEMQDHRLIPPRIPLLITQLHAPATRERAFQELFEVR